MTGIEELATRGDLVDRALVPYLPTIPERRRRTEAAFWAEFEHARPTILGALLTAVSTALAREHEVRLDRLRRLADFSHLGRSGRTGSRLETGQLPRRLLRQPRGGERAHPRSVPDRPGASRSRSGRFVGTSTNLLAALAADAGEEKTKTKAWPKSASALSGALRRLSPNLRAVGVSIEFDRTGRKRLIRIGTAAENAVTPVTASQTQAPSRAAYDGDDGDDGDSRTDSNGRQPRLSAQERNALSDKVARETLARQEAESLEADRRYGEQEGFDLP